MSPDVNLVVVFKAASSTSYSKQQIREEAEKAEAQYSALLDTLHNAGLYAVGRRGEKQGQLIVLIRASNEQLSRLILRERHSDFLNGLNTSALPTNPRELDPTQLCPSDRLRLLHEYITSTPDDGGLGVSSDSQQWDRVESVMTIHDPEFNEVWLRSLTKRRVRYEQLDTIRSEFGEAVAYYFAFLVTYTDFLIPISATGVLFHYFGTPYSIPYSVILFVWAVVFTEWWRIRERMLAVRWGTRGSFRVEKRRAQYTDPIPWWKRELRMLVSLPVILLFAGILFALLTAIFVFEAFVTTLYTGPGHQYISLLPTVLFVVLVPRFMAVYLSFAEKLTAWENHRHQSTHDSSITIKTFSLSAIVAYLGLALSAFIYVPFGEPIMSFVQMHVLHSPTTFASRAPLAGMNTTLTTGKLSAATEKIPKEGVKQLFETDVMEGKNKLNRSRLQNQMFAFTVTNQVIGTFLEVGLPFIMRAVGSFRAGKGVTGKKRSNSGSGNAVNGGKKKRVGFAEDETPGGKEEREFLERVREEVALPEYGLFADYSEMITQFGYVVLWSTIWPLAPAMALVNNIFELRSDAFKIVSHFRRPIPHRADTIGPWLSCLSFLTWLSALTNSALVYLFRPASPALPLTTTLEREHDFTAGGIASGQYPTHSPTDSIARTRDLYLTAALIALGASHGYIVLRVLVRHLLERLLWMGSVEEEVNEAGQRAIKEKYLSSVGVGVGKSGLPGQQLAGGGKIGGGNGAGVEGLGSVVDGDGEGGLTVKPGVVRVGDVKEEGLHPIWGRDEGLEEIRRVVKDA